MTCHRVTCSNENQIVKHCPPRCTQAPMLVKKSPCADYIQEIERIYVEEDCCPTPTHHCISKSCVG